MDQIENFVQVELTDLPYSDTDLVFYVDNASNLLPNPENGLGRYNLVVFNYKYRNPSDDPNVEIVRVVVVDGDMVEVQRGQEGTTASAKVAGETYKMVLAATKNLFNQIADELADKASLSGGADADFTIMPFVGGDPIIESDSNDFGKWIRTSEGTQIVVGKGSQTISINNSIGALYRTSNIGFSVDFPATFIVSPKVSVSALRREDAPIITNALDTNITTTDFLVIHYSTVSGTQGVAYTFIGIGDWK